LSLHHYLYQISLRSTIERLPTEWRTVSSIVRFVRIEALKGRVMAQQALFSGLVYDIRDLVVDIAFIGSDAHYVVDDSGFLRHIDAELVDRQVLAIFIQQIQEHKDLAIEQALKFIGRDDLFTKAAIDSSMRNIDMDQIVQQGIPEQARNMMGMLGFRIIIDHHGEVVRLDQPVAPDVGD